MTDTLTAPAERPKTALMLAAVKRRLAPLERHFDAHGWGAALAVGFLAAIIRIVNLAQPNQEIFDEVYYANDANDMLSHGVEWDNNNNGPGYVVHPPLGKWMIALGIKTFGYDTFGWRISAAVIGVISIIMITRIAQRLFGSLVLAVAAGLLMTFDGMHFVMSRTALLDIFLMFFILAAFGALVIDRDKRRERWTTFIKGGGDPSGKGRLSRPPFAVPWWRLLAAVMLGCALGVKWSAAFVFPAAVILIIWWEIGARRSAGVRHPVLDTVLDEGLWVLACAVLVVGVYLATWSGWFLTDDGYFRHFSGNALYNLYRYHEAATDFHTHLDDSHPYASQAWQWLVLGRPVAFYFVKTIPCGAVDCSAEVVLLGTPILWWAFLPALAAALWFGIARRDWRAGAILTMVAFLILPWFLFPSRTMFYFYALPAEPFLILAVVFVLGALITPPPGMRRDDNRLLVGTVIAGAFVLLVVLNFVYFFPIYTGESIPTADWVKRMWLGNRWI